MKQNIFFRVIVAIAMMLIGWLPSLAHDFEVDGVFYNETSDNTAAVTYKGYSHDSYLNEYAGDVVIPSSVNYYGVTYSVTSIGDGAFAWCESLTNIEIPNSVTSIGSYAFNSCTSLLSIEIPNSVTSIGDDAFAYCYDLTSIQIPNSVTSIGEGAFYKCSRLTSIEIPNSVTWIGDEAFYDCSSLTSIEIPNSVTSVGDGAFDGCKSLTSIEIPNSVTSIGEYAFSDCESLTSVVWNAKKCSDFSSSSRPFENSPNITSFTLGDEVEHIPAYLCYNLSSLTSIQIPNSVTSIGGSAFEGCKSLTSIEIPNSVTGIGNSAFHDCSSLTSIEIPNSVTSVGDGAFWNCTSLTSVVWNAKKCSDFSSSSRPFENSPNITSFTFGDEVEHIPAYLCYNLSSLTSIQIPNSVTGIGNSAFEGCKSLTSIEIPNSVTGIGNSAFEGCKSLTSIQIPNSVTGIGNSAFEGCKSLTSIEIPNSVTGIGNSAFEGCKSLTSIEIPNSVTSIGEYAFYNCESLTSVIWNSVRCSDFYLIYTPFENCPNITSFTFGDEVEHIPAYLCYNLSKLTSIQIPNSVTSIGYYAFRYCSGLTSVEIGNSVTSIGYYAFWECSSLTSIVVDAGNTKYDSRNGCNAIIETASSTLIVGCQNTIIPNSVTSIGEGAFGGCDSLRSIVIPNSVTSIGEGAFGGCDSLRSIVIPNSVTSIGEGAFYKCSRLTSIEIPNSVTWIGDEAFYDCTSLTKITCWATTPPAIYSNTFSNYDADLYVPAGCISAYQSANHWKKFYNIKEIPTLSTSIALNKTSASLKVTETLTLVATVLPELTTNKSLTWTSSNEAVATVDVNGVVTAIALGEATITATTTDGTNLSATCKVTVVPTLVVSIEVTPNSVEAEENSEVQLSVNILPENATYKSVEWSSSNDAIASVNANGLVKIRKEGNVVITATTTDGTNLSATCRINVYSGIDGVNGDDVIVATVGDNIVVKNAQLGSVVNVYASNGALIASEEATDGSVVVEAPVKGVYVVKVGKQTVKVII